MDKRTWIAILLLLPFATNAQDEVKRNLFFGNARYDTEQYDEAIAYYQEAIGHDPFSYRSHFNMGNAYFRKQDFEKAADVYATIVDLAPTTYDRSKVYHNLGNAQLFNQKIDEAIESYKSALRLNPGDEETRYNLAYALELKKQQQQQQQQQNQNQNQNQDQNQDQDQNQGGNQDQDQNQGGNQDQDQNQGGNQDQNGNQDQDDNQDQNNQQSGDGQNGEEKNEQDGAIPEKISKEQARRILEAAYKREKEIQKMLEEKKKVGEGQSSKKDW